MVYKPRGWQTLRLAEPGHQGWHAIMLAARSHSFPVPLVPSTTLRIPGSLERGFWGWSTDSGFPTTWADHYPRPLAQLFPAPEKAVGSPVCECACACMRTCTRLHVHSCKPDSTLLMLAVVVQSSGKGFHRNLQLSRFPHLTLISNVPAGRGPELTFCSPHSYF